MELNINYKREGAFNILRFKKNLNDFLVRNQIISCISCADFLDFTSCWKSILTDNLINYSFKDTNDEVGFVQNKNKAFVLLDELLNSQLHKGLKPDAQSVANLLIFFTKSYINVLQENKFFYADIDYSCDTLILCSTQELFNFSKQYFKLAFKQKKVNFDEIIKKEMTSLINDYRFNNVYFRKPITTSDKIFILKNLDTVKRCLNKISEDLDIEKSILSLHGAISLSIEPNILDYSTTRGYMTTMNNHHIISLGKYTTEKELLETFIHEFAHCMDFLNKKQENSLTYSEQVLMELSDINFIDFTPLHQLMLCQINSNYSNVESYKYEHDNKLHHFGQEILNLLVDCFDVTKKISFGKTRETMENFDQIFYGLLNDQYEDERYKFLELFVRHCLILNDYSYIGKDKILDLPIDRTILEEEKLKLDKIYQDMKEIACRHRLVIHSEQTVFFLSEKQSTIIAEDNINGKKYWCNPKEIFARSFELIYREVESVGYIFSEDKKQLQKLLKETVKYIIDENSLLKNLEHKEKLSGLSKSNEISKNKEQRKIKC